MKSIKRTDLRDMGGRSRWRKVFLLVALAATSSTPARASKPADSLTTNSSAAPQIDIRTLSYMIGEWSVRTYTRNHEGGFEPMADTSMFRARYLRDGLSVMAEYFERRIDGFYGFHIVNFDASRGFVHRYFDARRNQRIEFDGAFNGDRYQITRRGGYNGKGSFLYREVDLNIEADAFVKRIYSSQDEGATWVEGDYYFRFERGALDVEPPANNGP